MTDQEIAARIRDIAKTDELFSGPVKGSVIEAAEQTLGVKFPRSYRIFLREVGTGVCGINDIFGIPKDETDVSVVGMNQSLRHNDKHHPMPRSLVCVSGNDGGILYYLNTAIETEPGENPVIAFGETEYGIVAGLTFLDFIESSHNGGGWEPVAFPRTLPEGCVRPPYLKPLHTSRPRGGGQ